MKVHTGLLGRFDDAGDLVKAMNLTGFDEVHSAEVARDPCSHTLRTPIFTSVNSIEALGDPHAQRELVQRSAA
jgi:hypothetical protein